MADFSFTVKGLEPNELLVKQLNGIEAISELYQFDIDLVSLNPRVDFDQVIGKDVSLVLQTGEGERRINGIACRFEQLGTETRHTNYRVRLVPRVWTLGLRRRS